MDYDYWMIYSILRTNFLPALKNCFHYIFSLLIIPVPFPNLSFSLLKVSGECEDVSISFDDGGGGLPVKDTAVG